VQNCYFTGTSVSGARYVGGVVGNKYGTIQNCFASGTANGASEVGGVVGNGTGGGGTPFIMQSCYSTSIVSGSGNYIGGVVGMRNSTSQVQDCVALNPSVVSTGSITGIGRVVGTITTGLSGNYARDTMSVTTAGTWTPVISTTGKDGADVNTTTPDGGYNTQLFWQNTMGWDFTPGTGVWVMSGGLPVLQ
jgi:hypothetical protein